MVPRTGANHGATFALRSYCATVPGRILRVGGSMAPTLSGTDILITGGTGSFARAFTRRALADGARRVVIFSRSESKQAAVRAWLDSNVYSAGTWTRLSATRYGNVVGSTGSAVPTWRAQATHGQAITITDPAMSRFYMSMDAAVDLVILALATMRGGEVLIP